MGLNKEEAKGEAKGKSKKSREEQRAEHDKKIEKSLPAILPALRNMAKDNKKATSFLELFEKAPNQRISYKKFKDYLHDTLKIVADE